MSTIVVKAQIFGIVDEFAPVLVWRELGVLVEHIVGHVIHEPVETLTLQFLFQPATKNFRSMLRNLLSTIEIRD